MCRPAHASSPSGTNSAGSVAVPRASSRPVTVRSTPAARKIRERVRDPAVADKLIPKDHGFGTRRLPLESGYYEAYNRPNVRLVDIVETPIERITPAGVRTSAEDFAFGDSDPVVMTEKDAVKCKRIVAGNPQAQFWVFPVSASLDRAFERWLLEKLGGSKAA